MFVCVKIIIIFVISKKDKYGNKGSNNKGGNVAESKRASQ